MPHVRRALPRRMIVGLAPLVALAACAPQDDDAVEMFVADTGETPLTAPTFIDPASGQLSLATTRTTDVRLQVANIDPARTGLVLDGIAMGNLGSTAALGTLTDSELRLRLRGASVPGRHRIVLQTPTANEALLSEEITIEFAPTPGPTLSATVGQPQGSASIVAGFGTQLMVALDDSDPDDPRLTVVHTGTDGWAWDEARTVRVPGYVHAPGSRGLAVGAQLRRAPDGSPDRLRVAWRQDDPGRSVAWLDTAWDQADLDTPGATVLTLSAALTGPVEYAQWGRPFVLGDTLLAELVAATDTEVPRPGDRALIQARLTGTPAVVGPPQRVSFGARMDIDMLGPAIDLVHDEVGGGPLIAARLGQLRSVVLEIGTHDGLLAVRPSRGDGDARTFAFTNTPLWTVVGAFGSRLVAAAAVQTDGRLRVLRLSDLSGTGAQELTFDQEDVPPLASLTGEPVAAVLGGAAVVLLPYGTTTPVRAVVATDTAPLVVPLAGLMCTSLAVPATPSDGPQGALPVACARDGEVFDAQLTARAPD